MKTSKTAGYLIAGVAFGAFVTLLLAPKSGAQTRKDIRKLSKKTVNQLDVLQKDVRDQVSGGIGGLMDLWSAYVKDGKNGLPKRVKTTIL
jgi:gas vesicle protein